MDAVLRNPGNLIEHIGEPGLGIDVVELRRADEGQHESGALTAAV